PVGEVDAVADPNGPVQSRGNRSLRARLLADEPEIANEPRLRRVAEIIDLRHAAGSPLRAARRQIGDPAVALPPVLVRVAQPTDHDGQQARLAWLGDVPDLLRQTPEGAQQIGLRRLRVR